MDPSQDFKALREGVQAALVTVTRSVNGLASEDLHFQRTVHPPVARRLDQQTDRLLQLASGLLKSAGKLTGQQTSQLEDVDDIEIQWRPVVDVIDSLLEKADTCLDEYTGLVKRKDAPTYDSGRDAKRSKPTSDRLEWSLKRANILKPQNAFERKIDNLDPEPWKPLLTNKPHAKVPLEESLTTFADPNQNLQYKHPYEPEILSMQYPKEVFEPCEPVKYLPIESKKAVWVDTYEGVLEMLEELKKATEIAVDLEHHDYRSYQGLLSLMQISTREKDWIIDTLVPWRHKLEVLNDVFADPKIVKVLHGAFMDVIWLQRDLGLYLVGLFDTYYACDALNYPGKSLAFLLKKFADFDADKKYQLADWRIRPLPDEMFYYARSDTHYLLYIYDMLRNELAEFGKYHPNGKPIDRVLAKSREVALQRYEYPLCDLEMGAGSRGWFNTLVKAPTLYNGEQFAVYKAVHKWRDDLARREDESPYFFMTQQVLSDIARIIPTDKKALWTLLDSQARGLKAHLDSLFDVIQDAKAKGANGPTMLQFFEQSSTAAAGQTPLGDSSAKVSVHVDGEPLSIQELKSEHSQLWGSMALSSAWDGSIRTDTLDEQVEIPFPYSEVTFSILGAEEEIQPSQKVAEEPDAAATSAREEEPEFTLKGGRKRKAREAELEPESEPESEPGQQQPSSGGDASERDDAEMGGTSAAASPSASDDKASDEAHKKPKQKLIREELEALRKQGKEAGRELIRLKREERAAKKAACEQKRLEKQQKKQQKQQQQQASGASVEEGEQQFDYSKAQSVLHAPRDAGGGGGGGGAANGTKGRKAAFDPYTKKSGDAPQGARKMNYEKGGRTATFKS